MKRIGALPLLNSRYVLTMIGFGLYWSWVDCALFMPILYEPIAQGAVQLSVLHLTVMAVAVAVSALASLAKKNVPLLSKRTIVLFSLLCFFGSGCIVLASVHYSEFAIAMAALTCGLGMGIGALSWGYLISSYRVEGASICIPGTFVAAVLFGFVVTLMIPAAARMIVVLLPIASGLLLVLTLRIGKSERIAAFDAEDEKAENDSESVAILGEVPLRFLVILFLFCAAFGIMQYLLVLPHDGADSIVGSNIAVRGLISLVVLVGFGIFSWKPDISYRIGLLLITAGFLAAPFTKSISFSSVVVMAGYTCFDMMGWIVVAALVARHCMDATRIIAIARVAALGGVLVGGVVGSLLVPWAWSDDANMAITMTAVAYLLVAAAVLLLYGGSSSVWGLMKKESVTIDVVQQATDESVRSLAARYRLTPRETELLGLFVSGRSIPWIATKLGVSEGTIRSHTRHIYEKTNVHSRQELIDFAQKEIRERVDRES
ncbi:response regulator transcription factor [Raoultibacter phocaeensis]|uniref:response regulator transcription factor n=1 Tax=Raoultibacter phocaeensis TaxID=2479841 RepID=UPI00111B2830|nr:LuxR C-terminal-related transcriptional regulator [Raoultibacter phocaeensis]